MSVNSHPGGHAEVRKRPVQARARRTVDAILSGAARIFGERGYLATTTNQVAEAAGVSIGSLYQYFPNKDALLVALEERHLERVRVDLAAAARRWRRERPNADEWVRSLVSLLVDLNDSPLHVLIYDTAPPLPALQDASRRVIDELSREAAAHLRRWGHRSGVALRARIVVVAAIRLVHDLAIRTPSGPARARTVEEIVSVLRSTLDAPSA